MVGDKLEQDHVAFYDTPPLYNFLTKHDSLIYSRFEVARNVPHHFPLCVPAD